VVAVLKEELGLDYGFDDEMCDRYVELSDEDSTDVTPGHAVILGRLLALSRQYKALLAEHRSLLASLGRGGDI
jgi:hypothetical protein